ncbi:MAG TPA: hypothetical protein VHQ00_16535 [Chloroflexota bacterium]|nr:hypothetical protein [Chloroflexota bacterium]
MLLPNFRWRTGSWMYAAIWPVHLERLGAAPALPQGVPAPLVPGVPDVDPKSGTRRAVTV